MLAETASATVPVNPLMPVRVIEDEPDAVGDFWLGPTALAEIVKSVMLTVTVAVWGPAEPLNPVTVTV